MKYPKFKFKTGDLVRHVTSESKQATVYNIVARAHVESEGESHNMYWCKPEIHGFSLYGECEIIKLTKEEVDSMNTVDIKFELPDFMKEWERIVDNTK